MSFRVSPEGKIQRKVRIQSERTTNTVCHVYLWHSGYYIAATCVQKLFQIWNTKILRKNFDYTLMQNSGIEVAALKIV